MRFVFGLDEAGRGPLAGPVVAAAVCLRQLHFEHPINDSKKMTPRARQAAFHEIFEKAYVGIGIISEAAIDIVNILNASHRAMEAAVRQLVHRMPPDITAREDFAGGVLLLVDGNIFRTELPYQYKTIIGGDGKSLSIACASVVAKVTRDRILEAYDKVFPQYGFAQHKGYPTGGHYAAIKKHGASIIHRKTFQGVL
ncbi:MAG: ribonuclease HII [Candidatus Omnitrophica bacterium]|nr:ribonuclease HII [Candidatus Omnitrophota bacterium]